jgi:hypothetical protein
MSTIEPLNLKACRTRYMLRKLPAEMSNEYVDPESFNNFSSADSVTGVRPTAQAFRLQFFVGDAIVFPQSHLPKKYTMQNSPFGLALQNFDPKISLTIRRIYGSAAEVAKLFKEEFVANVFSIEN